MDVLLVLPRECSTKEEVDIAHEIYLNVGCHFLLEQSIGSRISGANTQSHQHRCQRRQETEETMGCWD